jgi:two-component system, OmpR family, alkaline phosphatase synthesis response regulator PhoP
MWSDPVLSRRGLRALLSEPPRAIVVDDEQASLEAAALALRDAGFDVTAATSGLVALSGLRETSFDLVVIDVMLRDGSGIELLRVIRADGDVPVIMLGEGDSEAQRVLAFELGADDYITKPFSPLELASRGHAVMRRARRERFGVGSVLAVGSLRIDLPRHEVLLGEGTVDVTASEFRLLALLAASPGTVFTRREIMEHVWAGPYFGDGHTADTHVLNLRRKLETDPRRPTRLLTVRGVGFKLVAPAGEAA